MPIQLASTDASVLAHWQRKFESIPRGAGFPLMDMSFNTPVMSRAGYTAKKYQGLGGVPGIEGKPIVKIRNPFADISDKEKGGGFQHIIPYIDPIVAAALVGDVQYQGNEVGLTRKYSTGYVGNWGLPMQEKYGIANELLLGNWVAELAERSSRELKDWSNRKEHFHMVDAINRGYDPAVRSLWTIAIRHNPNFVVPGLPAGTGDGSRRATWSATTATYMQSLSRNVIRAGSDSAEFYCSASALRTLYNEAKHYPMIPVAYKSGQAFYELWLDDAQMNQLQEDNEFAGSGAVSALGRFQQDVLFQNAEAVYAGFIIKRMYGVASQITAWKSGDTLTAIPATSADATTLAYGPVSSAIAELDRHDPSVQPHTESAANEKIKVGYVVGGQALCGIEVRRPKLLLDSFDYGRKTGIAVEGLHGWFRPDVYNNAAPASATTSKNHGVMSFATYSPN